MKASFKIFVQTEFRYQWIRFNALSRNIIPYVVLAAIVITIILPLLPRKSSSSSTSSVTSGVFVSAGVDHGKAEQPFVLAVIMIRSKNYGIITKMKVLHGRRITAQAAQRRGL